MNAPVLRTALTAPGLGEVVSVADPEGLGRVKVRLYGADAGTEAAQWARVAVPFAGADRGAFLIPDVGDEVLVVFVAGDARAPVVVGGLWNGRAQPPEDIGDRVDRWTLTGKAGTRIAILEDAAGSERVELETPNGARLIVTDQGGGKVEVRAGGATVRIDPSGVSVRTSATVSIDCASLSISAAIMNVDCPYASFSGVLNCQTLLTTAVISSSYTPGAGNIW